MNFKSVSNCVHKGVLGICAISMAFVAFAQDEEAPRVNILQADVILRDQDQPDVQRLIGGVILGYRDAKLHCDSALRYQDGRFQTMGHVELKEGGRSVMAESMLLDPILQMAFAEASEGEQVRLQDPMGLMTAKEARNDLNAKRIHFPFGGQMTGLDRTV